MCALFIILADQYRDYKTAVSKSNLEVLTVMRKQLCKRFAVKSAKTPKLGYYYDWGLGLGIRNQDLGLGFRFGIEDWGLGLGNWIGDWDWGFGWGMGFGQGVGDWDC